MKVVVQRDELAQKLGVVARAVSPRSSSVTASQNGIPNSRKVEAAAAKPASDSCRSAELSHFGGSATRSLSINGPPPAAEVASPRRGSDGEKGMGSFEEEGELQARARARRAVRSMHVHVPTGRAWRLQVGQRADPGVRHLRRVQAPAAILTPATSRPWPLSRNSILELTPTSQSSSSGCELTGRSCRSGLPLRPLSLY
jgi:hypothetical protein